MKRLKKANKKSKSNKLDKVFLSIAGISILAMIIGFATICISSADFVQANKGILNIFYFAPVLLLAAGIINVIND